MRAFSAGDVSALRAAGAFVATGDPDDEGRLEAAMADVHTVVHVGAGFAAAPESQMAEARVVATAAANAGVRRLVALSIAGADEAAAEPLRRAAAVIERSFAAVPCPSVVVRTGLVDTPWVRDALATAGLGAEALDVDVAPVRPADLVELLVAFDRARGSAREGHLVVAADGPLRLRVADYLAGVGVRAVGAGSLVGRQLPAAAPAARLQAALTGPWTTSDPSVIDGWTFADLTPQVPGGGP